MLIGCSSLLLISCKKTWTCNCEVTSSVNGQIIKSTSSIPDQKKSDAKTICKNNETQLNTFSQIPSYGMVANSGTCDIE